MRTLIVASLMVSSASSASFASVSQTYCSNGEGTVNWNTGSNENILHVTARSAEGDANVTLDQNLVNVRESTTTILKQSERNTCKDGQTAGYLYSTSIYAKEILIGNNDQTLFPENIVGIDQDRKYIGTFLICEQQSKTEITCNH